jgi:hypothetical protein
MITLVCNYYAMLNSDFSTTKDQWWRFCRKGKYTAHRPHYFQEFTVALKPSHCDNGFNNHQINSNTSCMINSASVTFEPSGLGERKELDEMRLKNLFFNPIHIILFVVDIKFCSNWF